jgi:osmotically-inducible protein OsmY
MYGKPVRTLAIVLATMLVATPALAQETTPAKHPSDTEVASAVEHQLLLDEAVDLNDIDITVKQGIVLLTGKVENLLARERATHLAETVRGVRAVSNRVAVKPMPMRLDADVRKDVIDRLLTDPATDSYEVSAKVKDGRVTLTGTVDSWAEKQLCGKVAMGVDGVVDLVNDIDFKPKADRPITEIAPEIRKRLHWSVLVDDGLINVAVKDGKVTLTGVVGSAAEKRLARSKAWVAGVTSVDASNLEVQPWANNPDVRKDKFVKKPDAEIRDAVEWAAMYDPRVLSFNIDPEVRFGWVTLRGTVDNLKAKQAAEDLARHTVGVLGVTNRLKVRTPKMRADTEIAFDVRRALFRDPYTESYEIDVAVKDGTVTLSGTVDSYFERAEAVDLASRVRGVKEVKNRMLVAGAVVYHDPHLYFPWHPAVLAVPVPAPQDDDAISREIRSELFWNPFVDSTSINVDVEAGVATLTGTVDTWRDYHAATMDAYQGGAETVVNKLRVE